MARQTDGMSGPLGLGQPKKCRITLSSKTDQELESKMINFRAKCVGAKVTSCNRQRYKNKADIL